MKTYETIPVPVLAEKVDSSNIRDFAASIEATNLFIDTNYQVNPPVTRYTIITEDSKVADVLEGSWVIKEGSTLKSMSDNAFAGNYQEVTS